jgi:hypothetical protein
MSLSFQSFSKEYSFVQYVNHSFHIQFVHNLRRWYNQTSVSVSRSGSGDLFLTRRPQVTYRDTAALLPRSLAWRAAVASTV